jgi:iron complex outermembrane receptor protein
MQERQARAGRLAPSLSGAACSAVFLAAAPAGVAQDESPEQIIVRATRIEKPLVQAPAAIGVIEKETIQLGRPQVGLDEALVQIPGLFMQDRYNFAQDLRIAIRGFGARSSFGIRGIKILVDGIPETLPDGQGQVDSIEMGSIERIEVIRGPSSSLYGNASGGVISITTEQGPPEPYLDARLSAGEFGFTKNQIETGGSSGSWSYYANASRLELDGYRDHSETESTQVNARARYAFDATSSLALAFNATDSPQADDPGGLTAEEAAADPRQAAPNNLLFDAGESVEQQRIGLTWDNAFDEHHAISARTYYVARDFGNLLPTGPGGIVDLERSFYGGGFSYTYSGMLAGRADRLIVGIDVDRQDDDRRRFDNLEGSRGALSFDQNEQVDSAGVFLQNEWSLSAALELALGLRHDRLEFDVTDAFLANGDNSGRLSFEHTSPMAGVSYELTSAIDVYGNVSTSFETPTTTELANPAGGGFNETLEPQEAVNYEAGVKGTIAGRHWFEAALFHIDVDNELIPFELASDPGRIFFENAGRSSRDGLELGLTLNPADGLRVALAYTWSDFVFDQFVDDDGNDFSGNRTPGAPENQLYGELSYTHASGFYGAVDLLWVDDLFLDNANTVQDDSYAVSTLRMGYRWESGGWSLEPFAGVNNLFDEDYDSNVRINAAFGRYFEPAPTRNAYAGLRAGYSFR